MRGVDDLITFEFSKPLNYHIDFFETTGKRSVKAISGRETKATFDISDFTPGLYIYQITAERVVYWGKFLKN